MATLVCSVNNFRIDKPHLDMLSIMKNSSTHRCDDWNPLTSGKCVHNIIFTDGKPKTNYLMKVRGVMDNGISIDEIRIGGIRIPVHSIHRISSWKNKKQLVDIVFALDSTTLICYGDNLSCTMDFSRSFSPICYTSENCEFSYISALVSEIDIIAVDVTPISYTLLWGESDPCTVTIYRGQNNPTVLTDIVGKLDVINSVPSEKYQIKVENSSSIFNISVQMPDLTVEGMEMFYRSKKNNNGEFDISTVKSDYLKYMRQHNILSSGDRVNVTGEFNEKKTSVPTTVLSSGERYTVTKECGLYVVPDFEEDCEQTVCIEYQGKNHNIQFDKSEMFVKYNGTVYPHNETFFIGDNRQISVVKGSIILIISDASTPASFPGGTTEAEKVLSAGDLVVKDVIARATYHVVEKVVGDTTYNISSFFVYDSSENSTQECSRISHGLSDDKLEGSVNFSVLFTNNVGDKTMVDTINSKPSETVITTRTETEETLKTTFDETGISFDTDTGGIYFGASKDFRIQYQEVNGLDPAMLKIQRLDGTDYVTSFLVTALPP